jgi:hypothetical protein
MTLGTPREPKVIPTVLDQRAIATPGYERQLRSLDVVPVLLFCRSRQIYSPNS